jgi:thiamine biosynthesis lipoprotein
MLSGFRQIARFAADLAGGRSDAPLPGDWISREEAIMGTSVRVELWADQPAQGHAAIAAVMNEMHRIDAAMSPYKAQSDLSRINRDAVRGAVAVSAELFDLLGRAAAFSELSGGAFDITFASVGHLYDYRLKTGPSDEALRRGREAIGYRKVVLDARALTVRFAHAGTRIDLGGFAKGYAVYRGAAILRSLGIAHAVVTAGGDSRILGDRRGRPWSIGIRDPRDERRMVAVLPLQDVSLSTSGDYERYFEKDGERHHHLIDPKTGRSPVAIRSVTVVADDGLTSEALSKCVFVMGVRDGLELVESQPGVDAVVVDAAGTLHFSSGLMKRGTPSAPPPRQ